MIDLDHANLPDPIERTFRTMERRIEALEARIRELEAALQQPRCLGPPRTVERSTKSPGPAPAAKSA